MEITLEVFLLIETRNVKSVHVAGMTFFFFLMKIKLPTVHHRELYPTFWDNHTGKEYLKKRMYVCVKQSHFAVQQRLAQHCKSTVLQFKKKK